MPDRQDPRFPWSSGQGTGRGRGPGKHAAGHRPRQAPDDSEQTERSSQNEIPAFQNATPGQADSHSTPGLASVHPQSEPGQPRPSANLRKQRRFWRELVTIVVAAAVLTLLVKAFVVQVYRIPSPSMEDTLMVGDRVLVNKLVYHFRGIDRGDIVVFSGDGSWGPAPPPPSSDPVVRIFDDALSAVGLHTGSTFYIKRVIGLPGDHVACCTDGKVTVNGVPLNEVSYLLPGSAPGASSFKVTVPPGRIWVLGDNRENSDDSLLHMQDGYPFDGTIAENEVVGRAFFVIWPPSQFGDLPIPSTFQQAALHSGASGSAVLQVGGVAAALGGRALGVVAAAPVAGTASAAGVIGAPFLLRRQRRRNR
jgi:signal peptidase I